MRDARLVYLICLVIGESLSQDARWIDEPTHPCGLLNEVRGLITPSA